MQTVIVQGRVTPGARVRLALYVGQAVWIWMCPAAIGETGERRGHHTYSLEIFWGGGAIGLIITVNLSFLKAVINGI